MSRDQERGTNQSVGRRTTYGSALKPWYGPDDLKDFDPTRDLGDPGRFPYARGVRSSGYRDREWTLRQVVGLGTAEETNQRLRYLFAHGQTGFSVCGMGYAPYESSDPRSLGILGRGGVWIDTLDDIATLFEGIDMSAVTINQIGSSIPVFAMILAEAERRGLPFSGLHGTIQNVMMPGGEGEELRGNHCLDIIEFCTRHMAHWNHTSISARNMRDQGLSSVQEVAFGIYQGVLTVRAAMARGLEVDSFASRITFFFSAENELLEEVAKYRAARRLWARLMRERFGARDPRSEFMRFHVQTSALSLTLQQPLNNIVRGAIHALAAVMGGAQSLSVNSFDEVLAIPAPAAAMLSLRTQQIVGLETDVAAVADPFGGSYCIEALTNEIEAEVCTILNKLENMSASKAWELMAGEADEAGYRRQREIDEGARTVVGVNRFRIDENEEEELGLEPREVFTYDPAWRDKQIARLERVKRERDTARVLDAGRQLAEAYRARENIVPPMLEAVKAHMSIGEITRLLADAGGWEQLRSRHGFYISNLY